jgi:N-acetylglucosamine-6-sulfatase
MVWRCRKGTPTGRVPVRKKDLTRPVDGRALGMRGTILLLASTALALVFSLALVLFTGTYTRRSEPTVAPQTAPNPNFVFILADDMRKDDLKYMPKTRWLLQDNGMSFTRAYVSNALCCPSRATIMRGQYAHNTGVWTNRNTSVGGWEGYRTNGNENDNIATRLKAGGYRTALIGKYFNGYENTTYEPPGWDHWFAKCHRKGYFDYDVNDNGIIRHFGTDESDYSTDVFRRQTQTFIASSVAQGQPFFAYVAPSAPHLTAIPAPRDEHAFDDERAPRLPSFNEADVSDEPPWIQQLPQLSDRVKARMNGRHEKRAESLQALDDLVEGVVNKLRNSGLLNNTYIVFTSDNGWHHGEHRIPWSKARPYEESSRMPLLVRGPGVAAGSYTAKLALNTDYFPTFTDLAGLQTPSYVDGRSLVPVLKGNATTWRNSILLEAVATAEGGSTPDYYGIRTSDGWKYIEYGGGRRELYNLGADPYELSNNYNAGAPPSHLASRLQRLKNCKAAGPVVCRAAENG